ncbi:hypothetical protein [Dactylosporangium sp. CA-092794]|uniref:hypothetical protein n=1 Tax=Dactylosporangium sp. CA-092794 TaxID=3239929 RepID=UPI003D8F5182
MDVGIRWNDERGAGAARPARSGPHAVRTRQVPGLFDLAVVVAPDGGFAAPGDPQRSLGVAELAALVRAGTGDDRVDVRVPVAVGEHNRPALEALAAELGLDVLAAPPGSELRPVPALLGGAGDGGVELTPVDPTTGFPVDWIVVPPTGTPAAAPTWFELAGGMVLARAGAVLLPVPGGGFSFATRPDFVRRRAAAAELRPGHPGLATVAVGTRAGDFIVGDYGGGANLCDGRALAASLAALPLYGATVRLWLDWPVRARERQRLRRNLTELAETTGACVWAPAEGGRAEPLPGCRDLAAVGPDGGPGRWEPHGDGPAGRFESDVDGRLVPAGGVWTTSRPGVPLVSEPPAGEPEPAARPDHRRDGVFRAALAVLADGRLALRYRDGSLLAAGDRQLAELLHRAGWRGDEVVVVSEVAPERLAGARRHAEHLAGELGCTVILRPLGPDDQPVDQPVERLVDRPVERPVEAVAVPEGPASRSSAGEPGPARRADVVADPPAEPDDPAEIEVDVETEIEDLEPEDEAEDENESWDGPDDDPDDDPDEDLEPEWEPQARAVSAAPPEVGVVPPPAGLSRFIDGPRMAPAGRKGAPHGLAWLVAQPQVNQEACELFVECAGDPGRAAAEGIPTPYLFLIAHLDGERLAARTAAEHVLRLHVPEGVAVDVAASDVVPPRSVVGALREPDAYLLPAGWLDRCHLRTGYRVGRGGRLSAERWFNDAPAAIRSLGAAHGVPGLPNDVERWPNGRMRQSVGQYLLVAEDAPDGLGAWQRLHGARPQPVTGHRLLEVRVERQRAIDVAATRAALSGFPAVHTALPQLLADGVEHLLPSVSYRAVAVEHEYHYDDGRWRRSKRPSGMPLDRWSPA